MAPLYLLLLAAVPLPVVNDRAPDTTSLKAIVASVTRGCATDDERAIALYNYSRYVLYHHAYPEEPGGIGALKLFNVYGWGLCGGEHTALAALFEAAGWQWRYRGWSNPGHTTVEAQYGGRWHYLDTFLKFYVWRADAQAPGGYTVASQEDIKADPALLDTLAVDPARGVVFAKDAPADWQSPAFLVCGDDLPGVLSGVRSSNNAGSPRGWGGIRFDEPAYSAVPQLGPGCSLQLDWSAVPDGHFTRGSDKRPAHSCKDKDYRWCPVIGPLLEPYWQQSPAQTWSNGHLVCRPDLSSARGLDACAARDNVSWADGRLVPTDPAQPARVTLALASPYLTVRATVDAGPDARVEVSPDGRAWAELKTPGQVGGWYAWQVRVTFTKPLATLAVDALIEHNQRALPYLAPGRNVLTVGQPGDLPGPVALTLAYQPGSRDRAEQRLYERGEELGKGHHARWDEPVIVRRVFDQLPATFTIDVPTPKDRFPVYPRMLYLRREVFAGARPAATPAREAAPGATLATLPEPWLLGLKPPAAAAAVAAGPTTTVRLPFTTRSFVSGDGQVTAQGVLRWPKLPNEKVVPVAWLLGAPTGKLPAADRLVRATLEFAVVASHDKAPALVAAVPLLAAVEAGRAYELKQLGAPLGTTTVKQGLGPAPTRCAIDLTRAAKAGLPGGLALRILPTRSVDDGWTVRVTPDPAGVPELVLQVRDAP